MALTPMDIYNKEFKKSFRGYDEEEVDMFLDQVVDEYEKLQKANLIANEKIASLTERLEHYRTLEGTLKETLMTAQNTAEEVLENARKKAAMIVETAQRQAREIIEKATGEVEHIHGMDLELRKAAGIFKSRFIALLEAQLDFFRQEMAAIESERGKPAEEHAVPPEAPQSSFAAPPSPDESISAEEYFNVGPAADGPEPAAEEPQPIDAEAQEIQSEPLSTGGELDGADALIREIEHYASLRNVYMDTVSEEEFIIGSDD